jgi:hypothetical protein
LSCLLGKLFSYQWCPKRFYKKSKVLILLMIGCN